MHRTHRTRSADFSWYPRNPNDRAMYFAALFLICTEFALHLLIAMPKLCDGSIVSWLMRLTVWVFLLINVLGNMLMFFNTDSTTAGLLLPVTLKAGWRYCSHCEANSPPRSVHCMQCNRCVLRHNHHCMFTGCCVGYKNTRYFIMLLSFLFISALYFIVSGMPDTMSLVYNDLVQQGGGEKAGLYGKVAFTLVVPLLSFALGFVPLSTALLSATMTINVLCLLVTAFMGSFQLMLAARNQTVHEWALGNRDYSLSISDNLVQIFGSRWRSAPFCAFIRSLLPLDGTDFPTGRESYKRRRKQN